MPNRQDTTHAFLQSFVVREILARVQADLIDICIKLDGEYVWFLHVKVQFSKFSMLHSLTSKKTSEITFYINLFVWHLDVLDILQYDNGREFKGALLLFFKMHNIPLINGRPRNPRTKGLVEKTHTLVPDKIAKWQTINGTGDWVYLLIEICEAMNNQTRKSLPADITTMQLMFSQKPECSMSRTVFTMEEKRQVLQQISIEDIDGFCEEAEYRKSKKRKLESHSQVEDALEIIPNEEKY